MESALVLFTESSVQIQVDKYLPALHHPLCKPNVGTLSVVNGSEIEFTCSRGDSNPEVNLQLSLRRPDGSVRKLGTTNVRTSVFIEDHNANFTCEMTSDTFPSAYHSCSTGPITVLPTALEGSKLKTPSRPGNVETTMPSSVATAETCVTILAVVPLSIFAFLAVLTNIYLTIKNFKLKKKPLVRSTTHLYSVNRSYMELQKTQISPGSQDYMTLQQTTKKTLVQVLLDMKT